MNETPLTMEQVRALDDDALRRYVAELQGITAHLVIEAFGKRWEFLQDGEVLGSVYTLSTDMDEAWHEAWVENAEYGGTALPDWLNDFDDALNLVPWDVRWSIVHPDHTNDIVAVVGNNRAEAWRGQEARAVTLAFVAWWLAPHPEGPR
jgi:hypothetical protein